MQGFSIRQLRVSQRGKELLQGLELDIRTGELQVLLGPNGAGKSSLMRVLAGEWQHSHGELLLDGRPLAEISPLEQARRRAVLPQQDGLSFGLRVQELLTLGRYAAKDQSAKTTEVVLSAVMAATQISTLAHHRYPELSGGEQRRVQLARVLAQIWDVPQAVLLLDEPTQSLDPAHQHAVLSLLRTLATEKGFAVLASLHDLNLASAYAQRISLLRNGQLIASGVPPQQLNAAQLQAVYGHSLCFTAIQHQSQQQWLIGRV